jgi:hypothetical protein
MSLKKIIRKNIEDNAVTEPKLANEAVTAEKLSTDFVTGLTELSEQAANDDVLLIYDTSAGALKKVAKSNTTALETPTVSSISPTTVASPTGTTSFTITGTGFTAGSNARLIASTGRVRDFTTVTRNSSTQLTAVFDNTLLSASESSYSIQVINGTGLNDLLASQVDFNQVPTFVTASGSLGSSRFTMAGIEVNATDPDSAANVTFELQSGSLPPGISLTNTGANGGTATFTGTITPQSSDTIFNFVLRAVDAASNTSSRSFSFTASGPQVESFTSSGTFAVPTGASDVDVLIVAGGGGGGKPTGGGGAGGLIFMPEYPVTPGGTLTVTVGCGGANQPSETIGNSGQNSVFGSPGDPGLASGGVLTAIGGGAGGGGPGPAAPSPTKDGASGGSGGGGSGGTSPGGPSLGGSATQPTQPGNSGAYGFGSSGGTGSSDGICRRAGGGGGGAGATGGPSGGGGGFTDGGCGGNGKAYTIADGTTPVYYAGGGGGGANPTYPATAGGRGGLGGQGGGGTGGGIGGGTPSGADATTGQSNKGGGGGGGVPGPAPGGEAGGKGIVIVRY